MGKKLIRIQEDNLTSEKVSMVYMWYTWEPYEKQHLPSWFEKSIRELVDDSAFTRMEIDLKSEKEPAGPSEKRHIRISVFFI
jgi:hypothetical protein